jgi:DNA-binding beta-propeller fold protein YncE
VTAYVAGPSLADAVARQGPLPVSSVLMLAAGLAEGLEAVHAAGLVHRDLKPSNVLLASDGPRIIDFGISCAMESTAVTRTGQVVGSPGFMSPEQADGREVGPASDVFSLGSVLAFAATGEEPFGTGPATALLYRVVHAEPSTAGLPPQVRPLIERCLAKDPGQRPTTGQLLAELGTPQLAGDWLPPAIAQALLGYQLPGTAAASQGARTPTRAASADEPAGDPATVSAVGRGDASLADSLLGDAPGVAQPPSPRRRRRQAWAWVASALAAILAGTVTAVVLTHMSASPPAPGRTTPTGGTNSPPSGQAGQRLVTRRAYVLSGAGVTPIDLTAGTPGTPIKIGTFPLAIAITPSGAAAYVVGSSGTVTRIDRATGTPGKPIKIGSGPAAIAIAPDGKTAYVLSGAGVTPIDLATGAARTPLGVPGGPLAIAITPDGATAYVTSRNGTVIPIDLATGTLGTPITIGPYPGAITIAPNGMTAYVTSGDDIRIGTVTPIDLAPGTPITVGNEPASIAISPIGATAYVANEGSNTVTPIDLRTGTPGTPITGANRPDTIAITSDGKTAVVASNSLGTVIPIDLATGTPGTPIRVGNSPVAIATARSPALTTPPGAAAPADTHIKVYGNCTTPSIEPTEIVLACADYEAVLQGLHWTSWTATSAMAVGTLAYNDCLPDCAEGHQHRVPGTRITLTVPVHGARGLVVWSRIQEFPEPPGYQTGPYHGGPQPLPIRPD